VTSIGDYAFYYCSALTSVTCLAENVPTTGSTAFYNVPQSTATLYVPAGSVDAYKAAEQWKEFGQILPIKKGDWVDLTETFDKSKPIKKIRILNERTWVDTYICVFFSLTPNDNTNEDTNYNINFYTMGIGDGKKQGYTGVYVSDCKNVGDGWYEYEFKQTVYFSHYQVNCPRGRIKVYDESSPTAVEEIKSSKTLQATDENAPIYDLMGRRLQQKPASGYYIQGGKKFYVK
jgi:hypothetical protein